LTKYLSGVVSPPLRAEAAHPDLGILITPDTPQYRNDIEDFLTWAADNGCFSQAKPFDEQRWLRWLDSMPRPLCLWATAPDVVGNHPGTLRRSAPWLPVIREMGFKAAFVAQNGAKPNDVPWDDFDVLFIGGVLECLPCRWKKPTDMDRKVKHCPKCSRKLTEWKEGEKARILVVEAKQHGNGTHVGRVNTGQRFRYCQDIGADSADGTKLAFDGGQAGVDDILSWLDNPQQRLLAV
jgi:hypothetical protein